VGVRAGGWGCSPDQLHTVVLSRRRSQRDAPVHNMAVPVTHTEGRFTAKKPPKNKNVVPVG